MTHMSLGELKVDFAIVLIYLVIVIGYGLYQGSKVKTSSEFFIADKRMPWWASSLAFATLVLSTQDLVSYCETGYMRGFTGFNPYLSICGFVFLAIALALPVYYWTGSYTVPEYLRNRYNGATAIWGSIALLLFLVAQMSFNSYVFSQVVNGITGWPVITVVIVLTVLISIYASIGGVVAVITVDVIQAVFLVFGSIVMVYLGITKLGAWGEFIALTPQVHMLYTTSIHDEGYPAIGMWCGISLIIAAYYTMHQAVLQKCLTTRSMNGCRMTMLIYGILWLPLGCFCTPLPGMVLRALVEKGLVDPVPDGMNVAAYNMMSIAPHGFLGIIIAAYLAAMISTVDSYINSTTTVFVTDIYQRLVPNKDDAHYLKVARIATFVIGIGIPIVFIQYFMGIPYLMAAFYSISSAVVPGLLIAICFGMSWKKFKARAASASIAASLIGTLLAIFIPKIFLAPFCWGVSVDAAGASWFQTVAAAVYAIIFAIIFQLLPEKQKSDVELFGLVMNNPRQDLCHDAYFEGLTLGCRGINHLPDDVKQKYLKLNQAK